MSASLDVCFINTLPVAVGAQHAAPLLPEGQALAQNLRNGHLEERVAVLEKELSNLKQIVHGAHVEKDWRKTFGMSANDPGFDEMIRLGQEIRQQEHEDDC